MKLSATLPLLLALLLGACSDDASQEAAAVDAGPGEESVLAAYDPALPDASLEAIRQGESGSTLVFPEDFVDLGELRQEEKYPVEFPFSVDGANEVTITALSPSCGCTEPRLEIGGDPWPLGKPIPGGSEGKVVATFNSLHVNGTKRSNISVLSNATNRRKVLKLEAKIYPTFRLNPYQARFGNVTFGEGAEQMVEVRGIEEWDITEWQEFPPGVTAEIVGEPLTPPDGPGQIRRIKVSLEPGAQMGMVYGSVKASTTLGKILDIPLNGSVLGRLRFLPEHRISFGLVKEGESQTRKLRIIPTRSGLELPEPTVELANNESGFFSFELRPNATKTAYDVLVSITDGAPVGRHDALLKVTMPGDLEEESRELAVTAIIRQI